MTISENDTSFKSQAISEKRIRDYSDFEKVLNELEDEQRCKDESNTKPVIWYRGQPKYEHRLIPSLFRVAYALPDEKNIFKEYQRRRKGDANNNDWIILFEMQHYGVPTRLLDWTGKPKIALYFALREPERNQPTLYLFRPDMLNSYHGVQGSVGPAELKNLHPSYLKYLDEGVEKPIAINPILINDRIRSQDGYFTIHGQCEKPLEEQLPNSIAKIVFTETAAKQALLSIERDLKDWDVFPDSEGLSLHIRKVFSLDNKADKLLGHILHERWKKDLKSAPHDWAPLFSGLRGCVLDRDYIPVTTQKESLTIEKWLNYNIEGSGRVCFVLGDAGAGKTNYILNAVRKLYYTEDNTPVPEAQINTKSEIVLWCALGQMRPGQDILAAVAESLTDLMESFSLTVDVNTVRKLCRTQSTVLVLDGLDELTRTRGNDEAHRIIRDIARELRDLHKLRVVVGCRSHIYRNTVYGWTRDIGEVTEISLLNLDKNKVANDLEIHKNSSVCQIIAEVPLFLAALRHFFIPLEELSNISTESQLRRLILREATITCCKQDDLHEDEMRKLGRVAALMIDKRKDCLSDEDLLNHNEEKQIIRYYERKPKWPLFVQESKKEWRFIHQSIREYILAWNIFDGFINPDADSLTNQSSSLDYESAEVYCFLDELVKEDKKQRFKNGILSCLKPKKEYKQAKWNKRIRNLFEAVGMLGVTCSVDLRRETLQNALEIIANPQRQNFPYANFTTAYNAVRCVERLHSSGPESYCRYRRGSRREKDFAEHSIPYLELQAYAVRGFQRKRQAVAIETPMPLREYALQKGRLCMHGMDDDVGLEDKTAKCLKNTLEHLIELPELDKHQEFMAANLSYAIIRWLPHNNEEVVWLRTQLLKAEHKPYSPIVTNLQLALYYQGETEYAYQTIGNRIAASSEVDNMSVFQTLVTDVTLDRTRNACTLNVHIPRDLVWIWTSSQKARFIRQCLEGKESAIRDIQNQIDEILIDRKIKKKALKKVLEKSKLQLRYLSGGTLPILEINGTEYYCLFYREIYPIGWNIANGGSANREEFMNPMLTVHREFAEELVIVDSAQGYRYHFYEEYMNNKNPDSILHLLDELGITSDTGEWKNKLLNLEVIPGPDRFSIDQYKPIEKIFLNVNMDDLGIEIDQVVKIRGLGETIRLFDGEMDDSYSVHTTTPGFINAPIGLFRTDRLTDPQSMREFIPDILFRNGELPRDEYGNYVGSTGKIDEEILRKSVDEVVNQFAKERLELLPSNSWNEFVKARDEELVYDLCPATRTLLRQYIKAFTRS